MRGSHLFDATMSWDDAQQHCIGLGGRLLEIRTQEELGRAIQLQLDFEIGFVFMWIGGEYDSTREEWIWSSNSDAINLTIFSSIEGLDLNGDGCVEFYQGSLSSYNCNFPNYVACDYVFV